MRGKYQKKTSRKAPLAKKEKALLLTAVFAALVLAVLLLLTQCNGPDDRKIPTLTVETPQKLSLQNDEVFTIDLSVSTLGDALYPAMSVSLSFDPSRLEFLGVEEGNVFILDDRTGVGVAQKLPDWSYNVQSCNDSGKINIMYLDMTGGRYSFSRDLLADSDNILLRLKFRLRGSVRPGDVLDLILEDAVFAASDEAQSLAMTKDTLKTRDGKLVVGE